MTNEVVGNNEKVKQQMKLDNDFAEITQMIKLSHERAFKSINVELINLYWNIGEYISNKVNSGTWGKSIVQNLAKFIAESYSVTKGFSQQNLWKMKQFYEAYQDKPKLSPLVREIAWTHNMLILSGTTNDDEKEFYLRLTIKENYSKR